MATRKISFASGEFYHLYNRGNSKQKIFFYKKDYEQFIKLLYICNSVKSQKTRDLGKDYYLYDRNETLVDVGAYCLMPNHFHILVKEKEEGGISKFMQKLSTAYVMYFNERYKRSGGLFEGKFKSEYVGNDRYLKYIFSYINLNPLKLIDKNWKENGFKNFSEVEKYLDRYKYSSFPDHLAKNRAESKILNLKVFPDYFPKPKDFLHEMRDWIKISDTDI